MHLLPLELVLYIIEFCPQDTLASFARVNSTCRLEAERHLYQNVTKKALHTLANYPDKCRLVRCLVIEVDSFQEAWEPEYIRTLKGELLEALANMPSLRVLKLMENDRSSWTSEALDKWIENITDLICRGDFNQLDTIYCSLGFIDVPRIIQTRPTLRMLAVETEEQEGCLVAFLRELQLRNAVPKLPIIITVKPRFLSSIKLLSDLTIFPVLYSSDVIASIHSTLEEEFASDFGHSLMKLNSNTIRALTVQLADSNTDTIDLLGLMENMASVFPNISKLTFASLVTCEFDTDYVKRILPFFPKLERLHFDLWIRYLMRGAELDLDILRAQATAPSKVRETQAKNWGSVAPNLTTISFLSKQRVTRNLEKGSKHWVYAGLPGTDTESEELYS